MFHFTNRMILNQSINEDALASGIDSQALQYTSKWIGLAHELLKAQFVIPITLVNTYN